MQNETPSIYVIFKADFKSPTLDIAHADYRRTFEAINQPFAVSDEEFKRHLNRLDVFTICQEGAPAAVFEPLSAEPAPDDTTEKE